MNNKKLFTGLALNLTLSISLGLSANSALAHNNGAYSHDSGAVGSNPGWMAQVDDGTRLSELNLPGTHDTMSIKSGDIWQNQTMTLREQLDSGIRVLDLRTRYTGGTDFTMHHGMINQDTDFGADVLHVIDAFLDTNPSETVIFRLTPTDESDSTDKSYEEVLAELISQYGGGRHWQEDSDNPTLADMRGKFVILDQGITGDWGINYWSQDIQDDYSMGTNWDLHSKWESVKAHMEKAENGSRDTLYMNYLSASGGSFPYFVASGHSSHGTSAPRLATGLTTPGWNSSYPDFPRVSCFIGICTIAFEGTNILTADYIANGKTDFVGMVMADFPGERLIKNIINLNDLNNLSSKTVTSSWSNSGGRNKSSKGNPLIELVLDANATITLDLTSSADTYLYLLNANGGGITSNDDGGSGYNSRITRTLNAGTYLVVAATYSSGKNASFNLKTTAGSLKEFDYKRLKNAKGYCMDLEGEGTGNGTDIHQWGCQNDDYQKWYQDSLGRLHSKAARFKCVDVSGSGSGNGSDIILYSCHGNNNQRWLRSTNNSFRPKHAYGKAFDISGGSNSSQGSDAHIWDYHGGKTQQWVWID